MAEKNNNHSLKSGQPLISVVIPVYNREKSVADSIQSVQEQTFQNWEIVAVDDGSRDGSVAVLKKMAENEPRLRVISQRNTGAQAARNNGIRNSHGRWVAFLDSDDQFLVNSLQVRLDAAEREGAEVVASSCLRINEDGTKSVYNDPLRGNAYPTLLKAPTVTFPGLLVSKKALEEIGYLDESIKAYQEWDTAIRLAKKFPFAFVDEPTFQYDCRGSDTMSKQMRKAGEGYEQIVKKHYWAIFWVAGAQALSKHYQGIADWYQKGSDPKAMKRCLRTAFIVKYLNPLSYVRKVGKFFKISAKGNKN